MPGIKPLNLPDTIRTDKLVEKTPGHTIEVTANIVIPNLPTSEEGLTSGQLWRDPSNNWLRVKSVLFTGWGDNSYGQLGTGSTDYVYEPVRIQIKAKDVYYGWGQTLVIDQDGYLYGAGKNNYGAISSDLLEKHTFTQIGSDKWKMITIWSDWALGIKADGTLWGVGNNSYNTLGLSGTASVNTWTQIGTDSDWVKVLTVGTGYRYYVSTFALKSDGTLHSAGGNHIVLSRTGDNTVFLPIPDTWVDFDLSTLQITCVKSDGTLWGAGYNYYSTLRDSRAQDVSFGQIVEPASDTDWAKVSIDGYNTLFATKQDGSVWFKGYNYSGDYGSPSGLIGTFQSYWAPFKISKVSAWEYNRTLLITHTGTVYKENVGSMIGTADNYQDIYISDNSYYLVAKNGTLWVTGSDALGLGGDNASGQVTAPTLTMLTTTSGSRISGRSRKHGGPNTVFLY